MTAMDDVRRDRVAKRAAGLVVDFALREQVDLDRSLVEEAVTIAIWEEFLLHGDPEANSPIGLVASTRT